MDKTTFALLLLSSMVMADTFTFQGDGARAYNNSTFVADSWQIGYGAQEMNTGVEDMVGEVLVLAGVALVYISFKKEKEGI